MELSRTLERVHVYTRHFYKHVDYSRIFYTCMDVSRTLEHSFEEVGIHAYKYPPPSSHLYIVEIVEHIVSS